MKEENSFDGMLPQFSSILDHESFSEEAEYLTEIQSLDIGSLPQKIILHYH